MTIAEKVFAIRSSKEMSLREFAKLTGVTHMTIARLESLTSPTQNIFIDTLKQICDRAGYPFKVFLEETGYIEVEQEIKLTPYEQVKKLVRQLSANELNALKGYIDAMQESGVSANKYSQIG